MSKNRNYRHNNKELYRAAMPVPEELLEHFGKLHAQARYEVEFKSAGYNSATVRNLELYSALGMINAAVEADPDVTASIRQMEKAAVEEA